MRAAHCLYHPLLSVCDHSVISATGNPTCALNGSLFVFASVDCVDAVIERFDSNISIAFIEFSTLTLETS